MITGDQPLVAEAISWLLATELGLPVPHAAVLVAPDHNDTLWLSQEISPVLHWRDRDAPVIRNIDALGAVIALDTLTLNNDRHSGNLIVQPVNSGQLHLWAIDSGNALVGWPGDFLERRDEIPDPAVLPIQGVVNTRSGNGSRHRPQAREARSRTSLKPASRASSRRPVRSVWNRTGGRSSKSCATVVNTL